MIEAFDPGSQAKGKKGPIVDLELKRSEPHQRQGAVFRGACPGRNNASE
jgi:hypothetical protein